VETIYNTIAEFLAQKPVFVNAATNYYLRDDSFFASFIEAKFVYKKGAKILKKEFAYSISEPKILEEAKEFTVDIVKEMKRLVGEWSDEYDYHFSVYSTPSESLTDRFCRLDTEKFGLVPDITDKEYYTNSFHYDVRKNPTPFEKLDFEKIYPEVGASGGFIHYCEYPVLQQNPKALEAVWDYAYDRVGYLGTNTPIDRCYKCDFEGDFTPTERGFTCPNCGNSDPKTVDVVKRTCGYLGNPQARPMVNGRHKEISARVKHMNGSTIKFSGNEN